MVSQRAVYFKWKVISYFGALPAVFPNGMSFGAAVVTPMAAAGFTLKNAIRRRCPDVTLIVVTNKDLPEYREDALNSDADHFISKTSGSTRNISSIIVDS